MELFIYSTNINNVGALKILKAKLNQYPSLIRWTVDMEDIDKVLRIVAKKNARENEILKLIRASGIECEKLPD